jgi:hypothetical protein
MNDEGIDVRNHGRQRTRMLLCISLVAALGVVGILEMTPFGSGLFEDSLLFIAGAEGLLKGHGYSSGIQGTWHPISVAPPLYSICLAASGLLGLDLWAAARWLNACLMGINIWLTAFLLVKRTRAAPVASLLVGLFLLANWHFAWVHSMVMTEPLFICFSLLGLIGLLRYLEKPSWLGLAASAGAFGLALATRFFGLPFVAAGGVGVLFLGRGPWRRRCAAATVFGLIASLPFLLFHIRCKLVKAPVGPSSPVHYYGFPKSLGHDFISVLAQLWPTWIQFRPAMAIIIAAGWLAFSLLLGFCFFHLLFRRWPTEKRPLLVLGLFVGSYVGFYLFSVLFKGWGGAYRFSIERYMVPLLPLLLILSSIIISDSFALLLRNRLWNSLALLAPGLLLLGQFRIGWVYFQVQRRDGQEFAGREWRLSRTIAYVRHLPDNVSIFSNYSKLLWFYTGRPVRTLPDSLEDPTQRTKTNVELAAEVAPLRPALEASNTVIVVFNSRWQINSMSPNQLQAVVPLKTVTNLLDGSVFELRK